MYRRFGKRLFDLALSLPALALLSPFIAALALAVRRRLGTPVLFRQQRPGRHGQIFTVYKFRTMTDRRLPDGSLLPDAERLTRFGRFLRSTSLDELPEFFNVLRGEMSLVGPRPLLMQYLERYSPEQARRHDVLPGITGWAQVNGLRGNTSIEERVKYDLYYLENWSLSFDFKILLRTLFASRNAY